MPTRPVQALLSTALSSALSTVLPVSCAGCSRPDLALCPGCAAALALPEHVIGPVPTTAQACPPTFSASVYAGVLRPVVLAWKDGGRLDVGTRLVPLLSFAVVWALHAAAPGRRADVGGPVLLVPVASSRAAVRARGQDVVGVLARRSARQLRAAGLRVQAAPVLRSTRAIRDQVGLSAPERADNLRGAFGVSAGARVRGRWCLLVDDVVTTGASLAEAQRALEAAGARVGAAATLAATARRPRPVPAQA